MERGPHRNSATSEQTQWPAWPGCGALRVPPWVLREEPWGNSQRVSLGDSSQTPAGASTGPGQAEGRTLHRPSLPVSRPPSDREETCAKCGSQRDSLCSNTCGARPPHPSLQPPRAALTLSSRGIVLASSSSPRTRLRASSLSFDTCARPLAPGAGAPPGRSPSQPQAWLQLAVHFLSPGHSPPRWRSWDGSPGSCRPPPQSPFRRQLLSPLPGNPCWGSLAPGLPLWGSPRLRVGTGAQSGPNPLSSPAPPGISKAQGCRLGLPIPTLWPQTNCSCGVRVRGAKPPTPRFPPQASTSPYLFIYLGKSLAAQAGNGPIPGGSAGLGNKEPHCAPCPAAPHPGPARSPERGTSVGARQEGGVGPRGCQHSEPARP